MKHILPLIALTAAGVAAMTACCNSDKCNVNNKEVAFEPVETQQAYRLVDSKTVYDGNADLSFNTSASMLVPVKAYGKSMAALKDSIMSLAFDTVAAPRQAMETYLRSQAAGLGFALADTVVEDKEYDGMLNVEGAVASLTPKLMSYAVNMSVYTPGAAHGLYATYYVNYDLEAAKTFTLNDIVTPEGRTDLLNELKSTAEEMKAYIGDTELESLPQRDNFYVSADGDLMFVYQPYEIASYAQGMIRIPVAPYAISGALTDYGKALLLN